AGEAAMAEHSPLAGWTTEDLLLAAIVARHVDLLRLSREQLDPVALDQQVDDERAAGLPLAIQAMTAVDEERLRRQPVANLSARAPTLTCDTHCRSTLTSAVFALASGCERAACPARTARHVDRALLRPR